ncbi:MAG TPA: hypothetical protein VKN99_20055 [Polyangia bacterium]|nr:hypothetical protein [Polyangia bacterium]
MRNLLLACVLLAGCSWLTLDAVPDRAPPGQPVHCTDDSDMPTVDAVVAVGAGVLAILFDAIAISNRDGPTIVAAVLLDAATPVYIVSSLWGYRQLDRCKKLRGIR